MSFFVEFILVPSVFLMRLILKLQILHMNGFSSDHFSSELYSSELDIQFFLWPFPPIQSLKQHSFISVY